MKPEAQAALADIIDALSAVRTPARPEEYDIHARIAQALDAAGLAYEHECRLAPRCRIDFMVGRIGIEVKKGRPAAAALKRQLGRYLSTGALDGVVVVAQRAAGLPDTLCGRPVRVVSLNRLWGVALP